MKSKGGKNVNHCQPINSQQEDDTRLNTTLVKQLVT